MERSYYVELPPRMTRECWQSFEEELNSSAGLLGARFEAADGDSGRTRVCLNAEEPEGLDDAMRRFRLFLVSRGIIKA